jgi:hypothetical protein
VPVVADPEMDDVERLIAKGFRVARRGAAQRLRGHRHEVHVAARDLHSIEEVLGEIVRVAVRIAVGRDTLVDLKHMQRRPWQIHARQLVEHRHRRAAPTERDATGATAGVGGTDPASHPRGRMGGSLDRSGKHIDLHRTTLPHAEPARRVDALHFRRRQARGDFLDFFRRWVDVEHVFV